MSTHAPFVFQRELEYGPSEEILVTNKFVIVDCYMDHFRYKSFLRFPANQDEAMQVQAAATTLDYVVSAAIQREDAGW
jgi:hypothetical protein